eukprot:CAMPEP_0117652612 /NCGR_PEP_ID=MMETSP0804-20121206/2723_1 /TAXON_ID=1074897 /ORGANISM="Tetraselmis astigmatica, Strain CCMP880" /LENGTH=35 /DNA_ID= /DNA_START= /DNA_END= /DNA_ORIENTATION=
MEPAVAGRGRMLCNGKRISVDGGSSELLAPASGPS